MNKRIFPSLTMELTVSRCIKFAIKVSYDRYLSVYQGHAKNVVVKAFDGRNIQFPADILKPYLTHDGVQGIFAIYFDNENKFESLVKIQENGRKFIA